MFYIVLVKPEEVYEVKASLDGNIHQHRFQLNYQISRSERVPLAGSSAADKCVGGITIQAVFLWDLGQTFALHCKLLLRGPA